MSGPDAGVVSKSKSDKRRSQPGDFERQVDQIRKDIKAVRDNLARAERALKITNNAFSEANDADCKSQNKERSKE